MSSTTASIIAAQALLWMVACVGSRVQSTPEGLNGAMSSARDERDLGVSGAMSIEELRNEPVQFKLDVPYTDTDNPRHRLDIYLPGERSLARLPVIVFFHGGGWMQGNKSDGARRLLPFVRTGRYAGISVGYRLSGEAQWPAQIHDAKAAIRWIRANAETHGFHADRIGVWGRNAGGHLALMLGTTGNVPALEGDLGPHTGVSSMVSAVANFFGASELLAMVGQPSDIDRRRPDAPEALLIGGALPNNVAKAKAASPVTYVSVDDAPALTVHGTDDHTVPYDQAIRIDTALRRAGVPSHLVTVRGGGHGDFGLTAEDRVEAFFAKYLRSIDLEVPTEPITQNLEPSPIR